MRLRLLLIPQVIGLAIVIASMVRNPHSWRSGLDIGLTIVGGVLLLSVWIITMTVQQKRHQTGWFIATLLCGLFGLLLGAAVPLLIYLVANPAPRPGWSGTSLDCPYCRTHALPLIRRRISTAGWVVFALLLVTTGPVLFWIGLLIKEDRLACSNCGLALGA